MARYIGPSCRLCRREGQKLFLKGERCSTEACAISRRGTNPPGSYKQGRRMRKPSDYAIRLREKQKMRRIYGILEKQFRRYFQRATRMKGMTGTNLLQLLETRLDNVVFRLGFAPSRKAARQLVLHRHFNVDGQIVNIPSFQVSPGQVINVRDNSKDLEIVHDSLRNIGEDVVPWLQLEKPKLQGKLLSIPTREEIPVEAQEQLVVEYYSR
ncbi:MAG TPA: 30S ribosomal protein S4 [candidate division Zixibacteria bacterium]|nr:30S ribosomal protein S4 [candidate division Zixibacteria bacterium]